MACTASRKLTEPRYPPKTQDSSGTTHHTVGLTRLCWCHLSALTAGNVLAWLKTWLKCLAMALLERHVAALQLMPRGVTIIVEDAAGRVVGEDKFERTPDGRVGLYTSMVTL
jgi:hypothetical protein